MQEYRRPYLTKICTHTREQSPCLPNIVVYAAPPPPPRFRRSSDFPSLPTRLVLNTLWTILLLPNFPTPQHPIHANSMHTPTISPARSIGDVFPTILRSYWS